MLPTPCLLAAPAAAPSASAHATQGAQPTRATANKDKKKIARNNSGRGGPIPVRGVFTPAAVLPAVQEARLERGCMSPEEAASQGIVAPAAPAVENGAACLPFAFVALPGERAGPLAVLSQADRPTGDTGSVILLRDDPVVPAWRNVQATPAGLHEAGFRLSTFESSLAAPDGLVPLGLRRELLLLVSQMKRQAPDGDNAHVRVLLQQQDETVRIAAVEIVDAASGQPVDSAVWLQRAGEPGAYVSAHSIEYERMLWQSPVDHLRISRGVGPGSVTVRQRVRVKAKGSAKNSFAVRSFRARGQHIGIDFAAPTGTPVTTVADGEVVFAGRRGGYGNLVVISHGDDLFTYYGHLSAFAPGLQEGATVGRGQQIGRVGSTGFSTGPHLHFEIRKGTAYVDPSNLATKLPAWLLKPNEHEAFLTRLMQLDATRSRTLVARAATDAPELMPPAIVPADPR